MSNNLLSKRIDNYFEKLIKQNNTPKSGGGIYESFIKPNALMIFLLIIIITIIICYCYHNANNLDKKVKLQEDEETEEFINHIDKAELVSIIDELSSVNERQKIMQDEIDYKMNYLNQIQMEQNNKIIENNEKDKFVSNYKSLGNYQEINNRDKILTKVDDINVEAPYV
jgi:predicted Holliday junction resolvase-like endonuclease